jgi:MFS transporter, ACS family, tartrate transporter
VVGSVSSQTVVNSAQELGLRARRHVAWRLLPFVFLLYLIAYIDRVNVSFANLRMSADLGFSDGVYGLGVGVFYVGYVLFEIPGAVIVERWSARKWIARIMVSWGLVSLATAFVHTAGQFYVIRFLLGVAEASFFPGMIVYLTHWFCVRDRSRAIACLYAAVPAASLVSSPLAGWLLGVHWLDLAGWRWLFVLEGVPAVVVGVITLLYLTDWPGQAKWLPQDEREWLTTELAAETQAKKKVRDHTIWEAFRDRRVLLLTAAWFIALSGSLGSVYWIPTFVKRMSGTSDRTVTTLLMLPALLGVLGMLWNGWHSDKTRERRWHAAMPLLIAGAMFALSTVSRGDARAAVGFVLLGSGCYFAFQPVCWALPTLILGESAAAATFGLINSMGQMGGFFGPKLIGFLNMRTHGVTASLGFIAGAYFVAGALMLSLRIRDPLQPAEGHGS